MTRKCKKRQVKLINLHKNNAKCLKTNQEQNMSKAVAEHAADKSPDIFLRKWRRPNTELKVRKCQIHIRDDRVDE